ncbi:hypothetical protein GE061_001150 [Apolygus lucorum]|uniref:Endonuclease/exonuclease/phosphatase domain-containing protein n=1 Tax=Apolygus lucorum TaxID=248454 RepID=A0A8S9Y694_APOLU|nr:hypothetical protein GE061_001150 [Apolygus lucorum]
MNETNVIQFRGDPPLVLVPIYLRDAAWDEEFVRLEHLLTANSDLNFLVAGDTNARIGLEQEFGGDMEEFMDPNMARRNSKDSVVNGRGRKLLDLYDDAGLVILNGRAPLDPLGEFTCLSARGCSVIDLVSIQMSALDIVSDFVVSPLPYSDHMPLVFSLAGPKVRLEVGTQFPPALRWTPKDVSDYKNKVREHLSAVGRGEFNTQEHLKSAIRACSSQRTLKEASLTTGLKTNKPWFTFECLRMRKQVFKLLRLHQKTNSAMVLAKCRETDREYKKLCAVSKRTHRNEMAMKFVAVKDSKQFWRLVGEFKIRQPSAVGGIGMAE